MYRNITMQPLWTINICVKKERIAPEEKKEKPIPFTPSPKTGQWQLFPQRPWD
jgi:hypothetical protein